MIHYNLVLVFISILIAILHSYVGFDLASRIVVTQVKRTRFLLLALGGLALGIGIWSMHFVGMFALIMPGMKVWYSIDLVSLSFAVAAVNSGLSLYLFTRPTFKRHARILGALTMAIAIVGMHYTAMYSTRMPAIIHWNYLWIATSVLVAFLAALKALDLSYRLNANYIKWTDLASDK